KREKYAIEKDIILERNKSWRQKNPDKYQESKKKEYAKNRKKYIASHRAYEKQKLKEDSLFRFKHLLRTRLRVAIKNKYKRGSSVNDLGCSGEDAHKYIESLFTKGMSWDN